MVPNVFREDQVEGFLRLVKSSHFLRGALGPIPSEMVLMEEHRSKEADMECAPLIAFLAVVTERIRTGRMPESVPPEWFLAGGEVPDA